MQPSPGRQEGGNLTQRPPSGLAEALRGLTKQSWKARSCLAGCDGVDKWLPQPLYACRADSQQSSAHLQPCSGRQEGGNSSQRPPSGFAEAFRGSMSPVSSSSGTRFTRQSGMAPHNPALFCMAQPLVPAQLFVHLRIFLQRGMAEVSCAACRRQIVPPAFRILRLKISANPAQPPLPLQKAPFLRMQQVKAKGPGRMRPRAHLQIDAVSSPVALAQACVEGPREPVSRQPGLSYARIAPDEGRDAARQGIAIHHKLCELAQISQAGGQRSLHQQVLIRN